MIKLIETYKSLAISKYFMKWKQHYNNSFPLYHLSEECHDGKVFIPRSMDKDRVMEGENWRTKRICVSKSIDGAISALVDSISMPTGMKFYVHVIDNAIDLFRRDKIYKPTIKQVPDCQVTDEYWLKDKAFLKCIGMIEIGSIKDNPLFYIWDGEMTRMDRFEWRWIVIN